jgi:hypothetical protein
VQAIEQGSVDLERSARQYLVLDSPQVAVISTNRFNACWPS